VEALYAAFSVNQLLTAGEEGVATGADFNADVAFVRRTAPEDVAAGADDVDFVVSGMNPCLHGENGILSLRGRIPSIPLNGKPPPDFAKNGGGFGSQRIEPEALLLALRQPVHRNFGLATETRLATLEHPD
jgi:hypothetical protein